MEQPPKREPNYEERLWADSEGRGRRAGADDLTPGERAELFRQQREQFRESQRDAAQSLSPSPGWQDGFSPEQRLTPGNIIALAIPALPSINYGQIATTTKACPTKRGIELVLEAAPQGDVAVAATSTVNNCGYIASGTAVDVVQATGRFALVKERTTGRQSWVVLELAFSSR